MKKLSSLIIYMGIILTIFGITYSATDEYLLAASLIGVLAFPVIAFYFSKLLNSRNQTYNPFLYGVFLFPMLSALMNGFLIYNIGWAVIDRYSNSDYSYTTVLPLCISALSLIMYFILRNRSMHKILEALVYIFLTVASVIILNVFMIMFTIGGV